MSIGRSRGTNGWRNLARPLPARERERSPCADLRLRPGLLPRPRQHRARPHGTGGRRGLRGQHGRPRRRGRPGREAHRALLAVPGRPGRRPGDADRRPHPRGCLAGLRWITALRAPNRAGFRRRLAAVDLRHPPEIPLYHEPSAATRCWRPSGPARGLLAAKAKPNSSSTRREPPPAEGPPSRRPRPARPQGRPLHATVTEDGFSYERTRRASPQEAALDGIRPANVPAIARSAPEERPGLQEPQPGRARLPQLQGGRPQGPARPPPPGPSSRMVLGHMAGCAP